MEASTIFPLTASTIDLAFKRLPRSVGRSFWLVLTHGALCAAGIHAIFALLFWPLNLHPLVWLNVAAALGYVLVWQLLLHRHNVGAVLVTVVQVHLHAALSVWALGWDSGFHYYLLTFVPVVFVNRTQPVAVKVLLLVMLCSLYLALDVLLHGRAPTMPLATPALTALRAINIATTFLVLGYLAYYYFRQVGESEARLREMAATDPLTGLANRRRVMDFAQYEVVRSKRTQQPMSIVLADIDHFKRFNDQHGHETGDRVLRTVAEVWRSTLREQDSIARWGGEEFLVVMPGATLEVAERVAQRLREAVAATPIEANGQALSVTMTFGVVEYRPFETIEASIARADSALYLGKAQGRNRVVVGSEDDPTR